MNDSTKRRKPPGELGSKDGAAMAPFWRALWVMLVILAVFGAKKSQLGVDFTDEGFYLAAPLRLHFGEKLFSSELVTLTRPFEFFSYSILALWPNATLWDFRFIGWGVHLAAYAAVSLCCFRICRAPWLSVLIPCIPCFCSNAYAILTPSYNTLSSDFLLVALSLRMLLLGLRGSFRVVAGVFSGIALFISALCYPTLLLVCGFLALWDLWRFSRARAGQEQHPTGTLAASAAFLACSFLFVGFLTFSGALTRWIERIPLTEGSLLTSVRPGLGHFFGELFATVVSGRPILTAYSIVALAFFAVALAARLSNRNTLTEGAAFLLAAISILFFAAVCLTDPGALELYFCLSSLSVALFAIGSIDAGTADHIVLKVNLIAALLAGVIYATSTTYFTSEHAWLSGAFGLPFAFATGVALLVRTRAARAIGWSWFAMPLLAAAAVLTGKAFYTNVYRDSTPDLLDTAFKTPKLQHIRSTSARVAVVDELVAYLRPKLSYGEPLLVYDSCSMLYFLLDAHPAYGLSWAKQYRIAPGSLKKLNVDFLARQLPRFAVRVMADPAFPTWDVRAPRQSYTGYPLNETVLSHYTLDAEIYPFEVWRLRTPGD